VPEAEVSEAEEMSEGEEAEETTDTENDEEDGDDIVDTSDDENDSDGSTSDEIGDKEREEEEDAKRKSNLLKRKRLATKKKPAKKQKVAKKETKSKKGKKAEKKKKETVGKASTSTTVGSADEPPQTSKEEEKNEIAGENASDTKKTEKVYEDFSEKNLDYNLYQSDPNFILQKKMRISRGLYLSCKMISVNVKQQDGFDYAALVFSKKMKNGKAFEFNINLEDSPNLIEGIKLIMRDNAKFFTKNNIPTAIQ
jgi:hypothetical protein